MAKRSKIRTENKSKEYQSVVSEPSLQVLYTHGLTHARIENFLDGQITFHLAEGNDAFAANIILLLQIRSLLAKGLLIVRGTATIDVQEKRTKKK